MAAQRSSHVPSPFSFSLPRLPVSTTTSTAGHPAPTDGERESGQQVCHVWCCSRAVTTRPRLSPSFSSVVRCWLFQSPQCTLILSIAFVSIAVSTAPKNRRTSPLTARQHTARPVARGTDGTINEIVVVVLERSHEDVRDTVMRECYGNDYRCSDVLPGSPSWAQHMKKMWFNLAQADAFLNDTDTDSEEEEMEEGRE